jgi:hypothetical protein
MGTVAEIVVSPMGAGHLHVEVREGDSATSYDVVVTTDDLERLAGGRTPEAFLMDCFAFLLEREPKESILPSFGVSEIGRYFPEFESTI